MKPIISNAANEQEVREGNNRLKAIERQEIKDIAFLGNLPEFKRFMYHIIKDIDRISACDSGSWTYFHEGERNVALKIKAKIEAVDPVIFLEILKEGKS